MNWQAIAGIQDVPAIAGRSLDAAPVRDACASVEALFRCATGAWMPQAPIAALQLIAAAAAVPMLSGPCPDPMAIAGPGGVDDAIASGVDLDGTPIPAAMLALYNEVMDLESQRARSGVSKSMRNRIVKTGAKHFDQQTLDARLRAAGWEGLKDKEIAFFYGS